jgi:hypothetical protein
MRDDPIVAEVRAVRLRLLLACDDDLDRWMDRLKESEQDHPDRVVTRDQVLQGRTATLAGTVAT